MWQVVALFFGLLFLLWGGYYVVETALERFIPRSSQPPASPIPPSDQAAHPSSR